MLDSVTMMRWSRSDPEMSPHHVELLFMAKHRIAVESLTFSGPTSIANHSPVLDIEFPTSYGKITTAEFVFDGQSILLFFEYASHAIILSLTDNQRIDIPNRKHGTIQGHAIKYVQADEKSVVALLLRENNIDMVAVLRDGQVTASFKLDTIDAQSIHWSPDDFLLLMVCDSATHGTRAHSYTAMGHRLSGLDISYPAETQQGGLGISKVAWTRSSKQYYATELALAVHTNTIMACTINTYHASLSYKILIQPKSLNSNETVLWRQTTGGFESITGIWDIPEDNSTKRLAMSLNGIHIASIPRNSPYVLVWKSNQSAPIAAIQLLSNPRQCQWISDEELIIMTDSSQACSVHWPNIEQEPIFVILPMLKDVRSQRWEGLSFQAKQLPATLNLFAVWASRQLDIIRLEDSSYHSILQTEQHKHKESAMEISTGTLAADREINSISGSEHGSSLFF